MGFRSIKLLGEAASADHVKAAEFPEKLKKVIETENYMPCQIINVDESGIQIRLKNFLRELRDFNFMQILFEML